MYLYSIHKRCFNSVMADSDPRDFSPPGFCDHGISQTRMLEWVAISFYKGSSNSGIEPVSPALQVDSLPLNHQGSPIFTMRNKIFAFIIYFLLKKFFFDVEYLWSPYWICHSITCFMFFGHKACRILASWPGIESVPPALNGEFLNTGPPGKPLHLLS